jgi:hypothetical protein
MATFNLSFSDSDVGVETNNELRGACVKVISDSNGETNTLSMLGGRSLTDGNQGVEAICTDVGRKIVLSDGNVGVDAVYTTPSNPYAPQGPTPPLPLQGHFSPQPTTWTWILSDANVELETINEPPATGCGRP